MATGEGKTGEAEAQVTTFLFSGYARLPQDVSHQAIYKRVGIVLEVDETGVIVGCTSSLIMDVARDFFARLLLGRNVLGERRELEALVRYRYRGHSQAALISALHKVFEAVDQSPLVLGDAAYPLPSAKHPDVGTETYG
ncbi:MAG: DUF3870 domain-containing protein [Actinobacteria bacterium]|nr:DUF3870 domain-containing protein [Acidobacteriota bacterium]NLT91982.1 DUF3870 domain-containing protein [Actinomycetota bacterium]OPZ45391.1 MAG: hypothetical protein BWY94_01376 [Actinobacteria bacterium ADurb.BinA094]